MAAVSLNNRKRAWYWDYVFGLVTLAVAAVLTYETQQFVGPLFTPVLFVAIVLTARRGSLGPTLLVAALSALVLNYFLVSPTHKVDPLQDFVVGFSFLAVALIIKKLNDDLKAAESERAQLLGVKLVAGEVADKLGNSLAVVTATLSLYDDLPEMPAGLNNLNKTAQSRLMEIGRNIERLQQVTRIELRETGGETVLDLDLSSQPRVNETAVR